MATNSDFIEVITPGTGKKRRQEGKTARALIDMSVVSSVMELETR